MTPEERDAATLVVEQVPRQRGGVAVVAAAVAVAVGEAVAVRARRARALPDEFNAELRPLARQEQ